MGPEVRTIQLGWNQTWTMASMPGGTCVAGTYMVSSPVRARSRRSPAPSNIVDHAYDQHGLKFRVAADGIGAAEELARKGLIDDGYVLGPGAVGVGECAAQKHRYL